MRTRLVAAITALLMMLAIPAWASHNPDHYSLPWSRTCSGTQTVVSHGYGYFWRVHVRSYSSQYFSYSGQAAS